MALSAFMEKELPRVRECLAQHPVERAWLFGSFARGEEREDSDVDFLLQYDHSKRVSLLDIGRLYADLHDLLGRELDLVEDGCLYHWAEESANRDKILIYERKTEGQRRLEHILMACDIIENAMQKYGFETILAEPIMFHGLVKQVEIIGEAVYMLTKEFKEQNPVADWRAIENMRHVLVHDYYRITKEVLLEVVKRDVPALRPIIQELFDKEK